LDFWIVAIFAIPLMGMRGKDFFKKNSKIEIRAFRHEAFFRDSLGLSHVQGKGVIKGLELRERYACNKNITAFLGFKCSPGASFYVDNRW